MPITKVSLSTRIQAALISEKGAPEDSAELKRFADAIAEAVVAEIQQNAQVIGVVATGAGAPGTIQGTVT